MRDDSNVELSANRFDRLDHRKIVAFHLAAKLVGKLSGKFDLDRKARRPAKKAGQFIDRRPVEPDGDSAMGDIAPTSCRTPRISTNPSAGSFRTISNLMMKSGHGGLFQPLDRYRRRDVVLGQEFHR